MYKNQIYRLRKIFFNAYNKGDIIKAILTGEKILKIYNDYNGVKTLLYANDAYNLACLYSEDGRLNKAVSLFEKSAEIIKSLQGKNLDYSNAINNMAADLNLMGKHTESLNYFKEVNEVRKSILPENHPMIIESLVNLGSAYYDVNDYDNALICHRKALNLREKKDMAYADNLNLIGYDYEEKQNYESATEYLNSALDMIKKMAGGRSDEFLKNLYYLAFVYEKSRNFIEAKNCYEKSVELLRTHVGENHPYYAESLNKLANCYMRFGNDNKALTLRTKALNIIKNIVGENHLYYASNLKNVADIYFKKGDYKRAKQMYEKSLSVKETLLGKENEEVIKDYLSICKINIAEKEYLKSETTLKNILAYTKNNKELHITILLELAIIYVKTSETAKLYEIYEKLLELEPGISFDQMLHDIKEFEEQTNNLFYSDEDNDEKNDLSFKENLNKIDDNTKTPAQKKIGDILKLLNKIDSNLSENPKSIEELKEYLKSSGYFNNIDIDISDDGDTGIFRMNIDEDDERDQYDDFDKFFEIDDLEEINKLKDIYGVKNIDDLDDSLDNSLYDDLDDDLKDDPNDPEILKGLKKLLRDKYINDLKDLKDSDDLDDKKKKDE